MYMWWTGLLVPEGHSAAEKMFKKNKKNVDSVSIFVEIGVTHG